MFMLMQNTSRFHSVLDWLLQLEPKNRTVFGTAFSYFYLMIKMQWLRSAIGTCVYNSAIV